MSSKIALFGFYFYSFLLDCHHKKSAISNIVPSGIEILSFCF